MLIAETRLLCVDLFKHGILDAAGMEAHPAAPKALCLCE